MSTFAEQGQGFQSVLSSGGHLTGPLGIAVEQDGGVLVVQSTEVIRIDPLTGEQNVISSEGLLAAPVDLAVIPEPDAMLGSLAALATLAILVVRLRRARREAG